MDTHMYTKQYDSAFLGSYGSFVMKDFVKKFIVLQIQTPPPPTLAACQRPVLSGRDDYQVLHPGIARMRNTLHRL